MKQLLIVLSVFAAVALAQPSVRFRQGTAAPSAGTCNASTAPGALYIRYDNPATNPSQVYVCTQTGASSWAWQFISHKTGSSAPAKCDVGEVFFNSGATAGQNWYGCTAADTWTLMSGSGGGGGSGNPAAYTTVTFSSTPTFTAASNTATSFLITLTGDVTSSTLFGASTGQILTFNICQDGTGGHAFVAPTNVLNIGSVDTTHDSCSHQTFVFDGTNAQAQGAMFVTGVAGGAITLPGVTSGSLTIQPAAIAGTGSTVTLPGGTTDFSATGGTSQVVKQTSTGAAFTVARLACADLSDSTAGCSGSPGGSTGDFQINGGGSSLGTASGFSWDTAHPGLALTLTNPTQGNDANDAHGAHLTFNFNTTVTNPGFTNQTGFDITQNLLMGQAMNGGATTAKTTSLPLKVTGTYYGSGQRFGISGNIQCNGMSDCAQESGHLTFAGGPVNGDENSGGFSVIRRIQQQPQLSNGYTISTVTKNTCNTTLTQNVTASKTAQTVNVASSTGCAGWVVIGRTAATGTYTSEAVNVTTATGQITGIFRANHSSGDTVLPAVLLTFSGGNTSYLGQDRVMVNMTATPYTTGTVASITGAGFTGSGTTWTNAMVGGDATNPGCVSLTNDNVTVGPFTGGSGPLRSWYEIKQRNSNTSIDIFTYSTAGDAAYRGNGVGSGAYTIRPCARVLFLPNSGDTLTGSVVLDNNSFAWNTSDSLELAISPYPDISGHEEEFDSYTPGGTYRQWWQLHNRGAVKLGSVFYADCDAFLLSTNCFGNIVGAIANADLGIDFSGSKFSTAGIRLPSPASSAENECLVWSQSSTSRYICPTVDGGGSDAFGLKLGWFASITEQTLSTIFSDSSTNPLQLTTSLVVGPAPASRDVFMELHESGTIGGGNEDYLLVRGTNQASWSLPSSTPASGFQEGWLFKVARGNSGNPYAYYLGASSSNGNNTGFVALNLTTATNNTTNSTSNGWWYQASVWDGAAAQGRVGYTDIEPGSGINNAPLVFTVNLSCTNNSFQSGIHNLCNPLSVKADGTLQFGLHDDQAATSTRFTFDPTGATADRTITMPDTGGTMAVYTGNSTTGSTTVTFTNSPCTVAPTTPDWVPVIVPGAGVRYIPACH